MHMTKMLRKKYLYFLIRFGLLLGLIGALLFNCSPLQKKPTSQNIFTTQSTAVASKKKPLYPLKPFSSLTLFSKYQLKAKSGAWGENPILRETQGYPIKSLQHLLAPEMQLKIFATTLPAEMGQKDLARALAYLFKLDPQKANTKNQEGPSYWIPPNDTLKHFGISVQKDSLLFFLEITSPTLLNRNDLGVLPDLQLDSLVGVFKIPADTLSDSFLGAIENSLGLSAIEDSSWTLAHKHFNKALAAENNPVYLINASALFRLQKHYAEGIHSLLKYPQLLAQSSELCGILGSIYEEVSDFESAKIWAIKALEGDPQNAEWLINLSDALWGLGDKVHSKNVLLKTYHERPTFRLSVYLAATYLGLEEYDNARQVLLQAHNDTLPSPQSAEYYLRTLYGLKEYEKALAFFQEMDEKNATANSFLIKAYCEFHLKIYQQAANSVKKTLALMPSLTEAQQLSSQIAALMGGRSNLILKTAIIPLKSESTLKNAVEILAEPATQNLLMEYPLVLLDQHYTFAYTLGHKWKKTCSQIFMIPDGNKLFRFSELNFDLNPNYAHFYVNTFRIYNLNLKLMDQGKFSDYYVTKNHNTTLLPENLLIHLPLKNRGGPFLLEVVTTEEAQANSQEFPYLRYYHSYPYPALRSSYEILHPPKGLLLNTFGETDIDSLGGHLIVRMPNLSLPIASTFSPDVDEFSSGFSLSPFKTWKEIGKNYTALLPKANLWVDSIPLSVREKAQEILDTHRGIDPVLALFQYVRDSIHYNNFEFNLNALIPEKPEAVLVKGFADCKGHALLLYQLLRARNIPAELCLISLSHIGDPAQPSLDQFNHMIVHIPSFSKNLDGYLDATEKMAAFRRSPLGLEGRNALIVDGNNSRLVTLPILDSIAEHRVEVYHSVQIDRFLMATQKDSIVLTGKIAAGFREQLVHWNNNTKNQKLLSWLAESYPNFSEEKFEILNGDKPDEPLILQFRCKRKFLMQSNNQAFEYFPNLELSFLRYPKSKNRKSPFYFPHAVQIHSQWIYRIPQGFQWKSLNLDREIKEQNLHWMLSIQQTQNEQIQIAQTWDIEPFIAEPDEYEKIQAAWDSILSRAGLKLMLSKL